jgi:predicted secreted hydrolase
VNRSFRWSTWTLLFASFCGALIVAGGVYRLAVSRDGERREFAAPDPNFGLRLPRDLAPHPNFRYEWLRLAGLVKDDDKRPYAFIFRWDRIGPTESERLFGRLLRRNLGERLIANLLCADLTENQFVTAQREGSPPAAPAGAGESIDVHVADWRFWKPQLQSRLQASASPIGLDLTGTPDKSVALYGESGYCWRGPDAAPVYYLGQPRVTFNGGLVWRGQNHRVSGHGFWEYEFTSYTPPPAAQGWDRFTLLLGNNHELNLVHPRRHDGQPTVGAPLVLALPDGDAVVLGPTDYELRPTRFWTSKRSGVKYPVSWSLRLEPYRAEMHILAYDREMEYARPPAPGLIWEGPCRVEGQWGGAPVRGEAFVELTGYAKRRWLWGREG